MERARSLTDFVQKTVVGWQSSTEYAQMAENYKYYMGENPVLARRWNRVALDTGGVIDLKPRQKIISNMFERLVVQRENRLLYYPIAFDDEGKHAQLGEGFDDVISDILHDTLICGVSWAYWDIDRVVQFRAREFVPILDDETGKIAKGIRVSQLAPDRPMYYELFEVGGKTTWRQGKRGLELVQETTPYKYNERRWANGVRQITDASNYGVLPIVPMYANRERRSLLTPPVKSKINAYDLLFTFYGDELLQNKFVYWMISGYGGSAEELIAIREMAQKLGIIAADGQDAKVQPSKFEPPHEAFKAIMEALEADIYRDASTFDPAKLAGSAQIATAIEAGQRPEDVSVKGTEREVEKCIKGIMKIAGVESKVTFTPYRMVDERGQTEQVVALVREGVLTPELAVKFVPMLQERQQEVIDAIVNRCLGQGTCNGGVQ